MYTLLFRYYLPLEKSVALYLKTPDYPSPKIVLCQMVEYLSGHLFWRDRFLNFISAYCGEVDFRKIKGRVTPCPKGDKKQIAKKKKVYKIKMCSSPEPVENINLSWHKTSFGEEKPNLLKLRVTPFFQKKT